MLRQSSWVWVWPSPQMSCFWVVLKTKCGASSQQKTQLSWLQIQGLHHLNGDNSVHHLLYHTQDSTGTWDTVHTGTVGHSTGCWCGPGRQTHHQVYTVGTSLHLGHTHLHQHRPKVDFSWCNWFVQTSKFSCSTFNWVVWFSTQPYLASQSSYLINNCFR